ncbi:MAG: putative divalent heavy-metal cations transporter [Planctomycetota bacterium]|nr:putative divalent heavy-metal cations transporter [Planctomycetota bacterium]
MTYTLPIFCAAIVASSLLGGLLPLSTRLTHTKLQIYLSFAAGTMLGTAFFHMMPEAVKLGSENTLHWSAAGLLSLFFLERWFAFHHHEAPADPSEPCPIHPHEHLHGSGHAAGLIVAEAPGGLGPQSKGTSLHWGLAALGLAAHTIAGGIALASAVASGSSATAWGVFLATIIHKPADSLTIVSLMLRAGVAARNAHLVNFGFSLLIPIGAVLFGVGSRIMGGGDSHPFTAATLAFSAGTFLCIALSDLLPELQFHAHDRVPLSVSLLGGFSLMAAASWWG